MTVSGLKSLSSCSAKVVQVPAKVAKKRITEIFRMRFPIILLALRAKGKVCLSYLSQNRHWRHAEYLAG